MRESHGEGGVGREIQLCVAFPPVSMRWDWLEGLDQERRGRNSLDHGDVDRRRGAGLVDLGVCHGSDATDSSTRPCEEFCEDTGGGG